MIIIETGSSSLSNLSQDRIYVFFFLHPFLFISGTLFYLKRIGGVFLLLFLTPLPYAFERPTNPNATFQNLKSGFENHIPPN
jgi:hypothetical protein